MKILMTGTTGFVGKHLVPKLIRNGHEILELTIEPELSYQLYGNTTSKFVVTDNQDELRSGIKNFNPEIVIHLASYLTSKDDYITMDKLINVNIRFYLRVLDALKETNIKIFINTGTCTEYFKGDDELDPAYLYSATKTASRAFLDYYSKVYNFKQITVVPYTIYGSKDTQKKIIDLIFESLDNQNPIDLSPGEQVLDFIHVDDVADFYVHLVKNTDKLQPKEIFKLGTGVGHTLKELSSIIENISGKKANINWGGKKYRKSDVMFAVAVTSNFNTLNWKPKINITTGIQFYFHNLYKK